MKEFYSFVFKICLVVIAAFLIWVDFTFTYKGGAIVAALLVLAGAVCLYCEETR